MLGSPLFLAIFSLLSAIYMHFFVHTKPTAQEKPTIFAKKAK